MCLLVEDGTKVAPNKENEVQNTSISIPFPVLNHFEHLFEPFETLPPNSLPLS